MTIHPADIAEEVADLRRRLVEAERERDRLRRQLEYVQRHVGFAVDELKSGLADEARRRLDRREFSMKGTATPEPMIGQEEK